MPIIAASAPLGSRTVPACGHASSTGVRTCTRRRCPQYSRLSELVTTIVGPSRDVPGLTVTDGAGNRPRVTVTV